MMCERCTADVPDEVVEDWVEGADPSMGWAIVIHRQAEDRTVLGIFCPLHTPCVITDDGTCLDDRRPLAPYVDIRITLPGEPQ